MNIKEQIKKDFGHDLNIGSGSLTKTDPLPLLDEKPIDAAYAERVFVRDIHVAKRKIWKINFRRLIDFEASVLIQLNMDTIKLQDQQVISETVSYYFLPVRNAIGHLPSVNLPEEDSFKLPYSIGWFHYDGFHINEDELGTSYFFNNLYSKMAVSIYDLGKKDIPDGVSPALEQHAMDVISEVKVVNPSYEMLGETHKDDAIVFQEFLNKDAYSALLMGAVNGHFIKVRVTGEPEGKLVAICRESLMEIESMLQGYMDFNKSSY